MLGYNFLDYCNRTNVSHGFVITVLFSTVACKTWITLCHVNKSEWVGEIAVKISLLCVVLDNVVQ